MDIKKLLGKRIKELRENHSLTQERLAELISVQPKTITSIETGQRFLSAKTLTKLVDVFNVSYAELFSFDNKEVLEPKRIVEAELYNLTNNEYKYFLELINAYKKFKSCS